MARISWMLARSSPCIARYSRMICFLLLTWRALLLLVLGTALVTLTLRQRLAFRLCLLLSSCSPLGWRTLRSFLGGGLHWASLWGSVTRHNVSLSRLVRRGSSKLSHFAPVSCHVALVFRKRAGKNVPAVVVADEIERAAWGGIEGGADGRFPRRADRSRRQPGVTVGVVRQGQLEVALGDGAGGRLVVQSGSINHRRVTLQRHSGFKAPDEHSGDERPLGGSRRLFFNQ